MSRTFHPGQPVKSSGIYQVVHGLNHHYHDHEVTILSGSTFPVCLTCGDEVRFTRLRLARAVEKHSEFDITKADSDDGDLDPDEHGETSQQADLRRRTGRMTR